MCGISAFVGNGAAPKLSFDGLKRLEYRGYDSWGVAWVDSDGSISLARKVGKIGNATLPKEARSRIAIAHTRWATHGGVEERNAHPHLSKSRRIAVAHNGIIENHNELRALLEKKGYRFLSGTDSEVIPHLLEMLSREAKKEGRSGAESFRQVFHKAVSMLEGSYAIAAIDAESWSIAFARCGAPLCVGLSDKGVFIGSDVSAFLAHTREAMYLDDGEYGITNGEAFIVRKIKGDKAIKKATIHINWTTAMAEKSGFKHFMLKEINEQPEVIAETLAGRCKSSRGVLSEAGFSMGQARSVKKVRLIACGTASYACMYGKHLIEEWARIPAEVEAASEFRDRKAAITIGELAVFVTQSGETADTLLAMREAKKRGAITLAIVNVMGSTIAREADHVIYTRAGPEIGVASTKAFTSQLTTLALLAISLASANNRMTKQVADSICEELIELPAKATALLKSEMPRIRRAAKLISKARSALFIGRGLNYPLALEGALKLKEISYLHAEGLAAGELKHGPLALVDDETPTIALATAGPAYHKIESNIAEIKARGGHVVVICTEGNKEMIKASKNVIFVPECDPMLAPIISVIPLQLLAYHVAVMLNTDIDKPRNLAKSVTVE